MSLPYLVEDSFFLGHSYVVRLPVASYRLPVTGCRFPGARNPVTFYYRRVLAYILPELFMHAHRDYSK
jgi:hypothetical protein